MTNASPLKPKAPKAPKKISQAQRQQLSWRDQLEAWGRHHRDSARDAWARLLVTPIASAMTILVIAIALALPMGLSLLVNNLKDVTGNWDGNVQLSVFLNNSVNAEQQEKLAQEWPARFSLQRIESITPEQALKEYRELSGLGDVLDALPENPLPPLLVVYPQHGSADELQALKLQLEALPQVDTVVLDMEWVQRLAAILELAERVVAALMLALAVGVLLVMVNTIRLAIENRREEILVIKTVGGTEGFIRRPFLYSGFITGLAGGLVAVCLVLAVMSWLSGPVNELAALYHSDFSLGLSGGEILLAMPLFAGVLGLLGAWLAVSRHVSAMQPQAF